MADRFATPHGFATVTPYITAERAEALCQFLVDGLGATELGGTLMKGGSPMPCSG